MHTTRVFYEKDHNNRKRCVICRSKPDCPLKGECLTTNVIYQATVKTSDTKEKTISASREIASKHVTTITHVHSAITIREIQQS